MDCPASSGHSAAFEAAAVAEPVLDFAVPALAIRLLVAAAVVVKQIVD